MNWIDHLKTLGMTAFFGALLVFVLIVVIDPYDSIWFSPPIERVPVSNNQRFSYPSLARNPRFDSLVIGTSSVRLFRPARLDPILGSAFVNLAMDSATPFEQSEMLKLFARHHANIRYAFFGVDDDAYCHPDEPHARLTHRPFPPWLYDENRWNDLRYLFNTATVDMAWRQLLAILGLRPLRFGSDGYTDFLPPESRYDLQRVRTALYGDQPPSIKPPIEPPEQVAAEEKAGWIYPNLDVLEAMLKLLPATTVKALILPPYHQSQLTVPGSRQAAVIESCKAQIVQLAETIGNTVVIDFWQRSFLTLNDQNYWDPLHYKASVAPGLEAVIIDGIRRMEESVRCCMHRVGTEPAGQARQGSNIMIGGMAVAGCAPCPGS
ncbi:MAG: hypothetical protein WBG92_10860 [Thiohalocapsa sp.]